MREMHKRRTSICPVVYEMLGIRTIAFPRWFMGVNSAVIVITVGRTMPMEIPTCHAIIQQLVKHVSS
jgi:hypothetical protein